MSCSVQGAAAVQKERCMMILPSMRYAEQAGRISYHLPFTCILRHTNSSLQSLHTFWVSEEEDC